MEALLKMFLLPQDLKSNAVADDDVVVMDPDEGSYQASFSKLGASEPPKVDLVASVDDPRTLLAQQLGTAAASQPGIVSCLHGVDDPALIALRSFHPCSRRSTPSTGSHLKRI